MVFDRFFNSSDSTEQTTDDQAQPESSTPDDDNPESDSSEAPQSRLGETYNITEQNTTYVGDKPAITDTATEGLVAGSYIREMLESGAHTSSAPLWIGYNEDPQRGFREAPLQFESLFRHIWITGTTGYGKTTEMENMMVQWANSGYGFVYFDPKGRDSRELLRKLPADRLDDVVWIEPGSSEFNKTVGLNFLEVPDCDTEEERENEIENRIENLKAIFDTDEYWGINMESITESMGRAMMQSEKPFSVIDMYFTLLNASRREEFAANVEDPYVREFCIEIAQMNDETVRPILKRIKSWVENSVIRRIISHRESTIDFRDIIDNDRIVIVRTPVENTDIKKMITLGVMRSLWSAIQQRSYEHDSDPDPYFVLCDEFDDIASDNLDIESMLARARSMRLSVTLASQYPSQFDEETLKAMQNNCDNLIAFSVNDVDDARLLMKRFRDYTAEDLISTDQYKAWTKLPLDGGRYSEPVLLNSFPPYPPLRSTEAVDDIIEQSLERYGTEPLTDEEIMQNLIYSDANEAASPTQILDKTMAEAVRAVQIRAGVRAENGWVDVTTVDDELAVRLENQDADIEYAPEDLPDVRDASGLMEVELQDDDIVVRLTEDGETMVEPETGSVRSAGGETHDAVLVETEAALTERGFSVEIVEQDGSDQPDAVATHPDHDAVFNIEAETTTPDRPVKVLQNLKRAHEADRIPIFVVRPGDSETKWANRVENILSPPLRERADGTEQFYNCDEVVTFGGGATAHGGVTAVRPRTSDTNRTVWTRNGDERVLSDGETEFVRVPDEGGLSKDAVPAYYSHDRETGQYTVHRPGETQTYDSKDEFEAEWTPIKRPFIPNDELPESEVPRDSYVVLILPADDSPTVFHQGETYALPENPSAEELWPDTPTEDSNQSTAPTQREKTSSSPKEVDSRTSAESMDVDPSGDGVEAFTAMYVRRVDEARVPQDELFQAYSEWTDQHDIDGTTKGWFTRKLQNVIEFDTDRSRVDGERVQFYVGITLTQEGQTLLEQ
ncbi:type IV secretion system DNA-binding domain-containing protein [Halorussus sp. MSC15.2]|uniref:type IV secretion system DNA-binding domain-containing protein n=1 Tax=Halorussus sp. MSC15.2 TaxID=2283638 RepID=UPI0013D67AD4|nr:type IV secretory system conjugative DNA transfer family protein [Halorussus sp. MSC15.2]NEU59139.1 type IV secretory system conjugative DNA transfer family protein [Halorussus sp. MSC15.2]